MRTVLSLCAWAARAFWDARPRLSPAHRPRWQWQLLALWRQHTPAPWHRWQEARHRAAGLHLPTPLVVPEEGDTPQTVTRHIRAHLDLWWALTQHRGR